MAPLSPYFSSPPSKQIRKLDRLGFTARYHAAPAAASLFLFVCCCFDMFRSRVVLANQSTVLAGTSALHNTPEIPDSVMALLLLLFLRSSSHVLLREIRAPNPRDFQSSSSSCSFRLLCAPAKQKKSAQTWWGTEKLQLSHRRLLITCIFFTFSSNFCVVGKMDHFSANCLLGKCPHLFTPSSLLVSYYSSSRH